MEKIIKVDPLFQNFHFFKQRPLRKSVSSFNPPAIAGQMCISPDCFRAGVIQAKETIVE